MRRGLLLALSTAAATALTLAGCSSDDGEDQPGPGGGTGKKQQGGFGSAGKPSANFSGTWPKGKVAVTVPEGKGDGQPQPSETYKTEVAFEDKTPGEGRWTTRPKPQTVTLATGKTTEIDWEFPPDEGKPAVAAHTVCATLSGYPEDLCGSVPTAGRKSPGGPASPPGGGGTPATPGAPPATPEAPPDVDTPVEPGEPGEP
ncbi:hypothetical protein [Streptomyces griseocarneus]|uniref:hypothetical protein n=1 Tax=Streptomyces griseocarneus TaxID=51201 RepID=UPI00167E3BFB|nr:hypothetical protein [Streptomyces griseocarneus]MBZ6475940.1 hypothetical protein [Streptomyces griseocarneus]GHG49921.1 hypothetical protein GCM10018779_09520 [Streptomyces griseocarneus]